MEVTFETKKLEQICVSQDKLRAEFGPRMSQVIMRRLLDLAAADNLEVMRLLPGRCHELTENLKGRNSSVCETISAFWNFAP